MRIIGLVGRLANFLASCILAYLLGKLKLNDLLNIIGAPIIDKISVITELIKLTNP